MNLSSTCKGDFSERVFDVSPCLKRIHANLPVSAYRLGIDAIVTNTLQYSTQENNITLRVDPLSPESIYKLKFDSEGANKLWIWEAGDVKSMVVPTLTRRCRRGRQRGDRSPAERRFDARSTLAAHLATAPPEENNSTAPRRCHGDRLPRRGPPTQNTCARQKRSAAELSLELRSTQSNCPSLELFYKQDYALVKQGTDRRVKLRKLNTIPAYARQKAKPKCRNCIRLERASQKQSSDTHKTPYDRVKRCRERKINIKASERVNIDCESGTECSSPCPPAGNMWYSLQEVAGWQAGTESSGNFATSSGYTFPIVAARVVTTLTDCVLPCLYLRPLADLPHCFSLPAQFFFILAEKPGSYKGHTRSRYKRAITSTTLHRSSSCSSQAGGTLNYLCWLHTGGCRLLVDFAAIQLVGAMVAGMATPYSKLVSNKCLEVCVYEGTDK
ncbi:hypothetical protein PR048_027408 [Dryococelus australis]|uniref:Uncharacterized protein n=1 Tax=Dryococelus australis TaxID=614101 RepID=A0ABQ9GFD6_9NEOP|nr:hypothetical protein PR048_027408 [Dryococelus australis]